MTESTTGTDASWARIKPEIDGLVGALGTRERDAILLRFFEGRSLADVGQQLGISADAARMRIDRGLQKLRAVLLKRGEASTETALAGLLAEEAALAMPAGLTSTVTAAAISTGSVGAGTGALNWILMAKIKTGLAAVFVTGVIATAVFQERTKASGR